MRSVWLTSLILSLSLSASAERADRVLMPLPASHVADAGHLLAVDTRVELDRLASRLDQSGRGELGIAVIGSTDGKPSRQFATEAFNFWGIGDPQRHDGVLLLLALRDRKAEIVLGAGIDNAGNRRHVLQVMNEAMVPRFRQGNYDQGLIAGATMVLQQIYSLDLSRPAEAPEALAPALAFSTPPATGSDADSPAPEAASTPAEVDTSDVIAPAPARQPQHSGPQPVPPTETSPGMVAFGLSILTALAAAAWWVLSRLLRVFWWFTGGRLLARRCGNCRTPMNLLSEEADDAHLNAAELTEERLRSVDYRVFVCPRCSRVDKLMRRAWFSTYSNCSSCHSRALSRVSTTISSATRYSTGLAEVTETCQNCHKTNTVRHVLPVLPPPSNNSSRSSSSSSSRSSFGGGRSSGGGASGSW
jgi:uncharacterized protein